MISDTDRQHYAERGFIVVRGLFAAAEMAAAATAADALLARTELLAPENLRCRYQLHRQTGESVLEALDPVIDLDPALHALAHDPRLLESMGGLYGQTATLFKDKLIYKPPGCPGYALHQDYIAWPTFPRTFTTALVALDPSTPENGCLAVYEGLHRRGLMSAADGDFHDLPESLLDPGRRVLCPLEPGDVLIFGALLPHGSGPNGGPGWRRHLYLSYNALADGGERRDRHYREFHRWLAQRYAEYGYVRSYFK